MPWRALFVDDEPSIRGIYEMLGCVLGDEYAIATVCGAAEAKARMAEHGADVIISDLVMPGESGAELLLELSRAYPECARIAVSGFADQITMAKCLTVAHRYFTKPFSPSALTSAIQELSAMRKAGDERLAKLVGAIQSLPVPADTYLALNKALNSHSLSLDSIAEIVQRDPSLCSKLLQAANSAMFGARHRCERIVDAIHLLGVETIRTLMLGVQVFELCPGKEFKLFLDGLWQHSLAIGQGAKKYLLNANASRGEAEDGFVAGLLHDLGKVVLAASCPLEYAELVKHSGHNGEVFREAEQTAFGATHAYAGAYLLKLWGLPERIVGVVGRHHNLPASNEDILITAVRAAHEMVPPLRASAPAAQTAEKLAPRTSTALVASSDAFELERLGEMLRANGYTVFSASDRGAAFQMLHDLTFQVAIVDEELVPGRSELIISKLRQLNASAQLIMLEPRRGAQLGCDYLPRNVRWDDLQRKLNKGLDTRHQS